jgi:hypothetical protein
VLRPHLGRSRPHALLHPHRTGGCGHVFDDADLIDHHRDNATCTDPRTLNVISTKNGIWLRIPGIPT